MIFGTSKSLTGMTTISSLGVLTLVMKTFAFFRRGVKWTIGISQPTDPFFLLLPSNAGLMPAFSRSPGWTVNV